MALNDGHAYREQVGSEAAGRTVLDWLSRTYRPSTEAEWCERIVRGEVDVGGEVARGDRRLVAGEWLTWRRPAWDEPEVPRAWTTIFEDEWLVAVHKPSGLPTIPGGGFLKHTLLGLVRERYPTASPMHRLGRETSGVVLFARTQEAASRLARAWRRHEMTKVYRALGSGVCEEGVLDIDVPIGPVAHPLLGTVHAASPAGKASRSRARVLERREDATLFEVEIETGRPHQIRVQLSKIGCSIRGDLKYGFPTANDDGSIHLHCRSLSFIHPVKKERVTIEAETPREQIWDLFR